MRLLSLTFSLLMALPACHKADPNSIEDQLDILNSSKRTLKEKERACESLRRIGKKQAVPGLVAVLKSASPKVRADIAQVLGDLKDPSAIPALTDALDMSVGEATDRASQDLNEANKLIARALGDIGGKEAVQPLLRLLKVTRNNYVRIETISALGKLKDPAAVGVLSALATDERAEPLVSKKAILALANINHPSALPAFIRMSFAARNNVSFYAESAFGIFLLGDAAKDSVLAILSDKDKELIEWAKGQNVVHAALLAKAAQMECDLQDKRAVPPLLALLRFDDPLPELRQAVHMYAAEALGRMRAKEAAAPISAMLVESKPEVRSVFVRALVQIGDRSVLPRLADCTRSGAWNARQVCVLGLALLGTGKEAKLFDALLKEEPGRFARECQVRTEEQDDCASDVALRARVLESMRKALETATACADTPCLSAALSSADPVVRERAAYELAARNASEALPALFASIQRPLEDGGDLNARFAALCAVDWIASADSKAMAVAKLQVNALEAQVEREKDKASTARIAEEIKRLAVKIERAK